MEARQKFSLRLFVKTVSTQSPSQHQGQTLTEEVRRDLWEVQQWPSCPNTGWNTYQTGPLYLNSVSCQCKSVIMHFDLIPVKKTTKVSMLVNMLVYVILATSTTRSLERHNQSKYLVQGVKDDTATCKPWTFDRMRICIPLFGQMLFGLKNRICPKCRP